MQKKLRLEEETNTIILQLQKATDLPNSSNLSKELSVAMRECGKPVGSASAPPPTLVQRRGRKRERGEKGKIG
jgi:hypothetical protein